MKSEKYKNKYRVDSSRLPYWDYTNPGMYFITICTKNFQCWFGDVTDDRMVLNELGEIANACWEEIPNHYKNVELDEWTVMPNHIHGIIGITKNKANDKDGGNINVKTRHAVSLQEHANKFGPLKKGALSTIIGSYKSAVTKSIRKTQNANFGWHPRFYDHVIRNIDSIEKIQHYIKMNPSNWNKDRNTITEDKEFFRY